MEKLRQSNVVLLACTAQTYDWGKPADSSFVAKMQRCSRGGGGAADIDAAKRYAELWVGTHPSGPSRLLRAVPPSHGHPGAALMTLADYLADSTVAHRFLSPAHLQLARSTSVFRDTVPFLLKILSVSTALSIQAHPDKALAEKLHRNLPDKYKDANHKPELIVALSPVFEAMCGFRPALVILYHILSTPALSRLLPISDLVRPTAAALAAALESLPLNGACGATLLTYERMVSVIHGHMPLRGSTAERQLLQTVLTALYKAPADASQQALEAHLTHLRAAAGPGDQSQHPPTHPAPPSDVEGAKRDADRLFVRLNQQYPGDVGCWMVYFLNYFTLHRGDGLFLRDSEPHAYVSGDGVEVMACSDNVVRAGLTPKWKDVDTLLSMLTYGTNTLVNALQLSGNPSTTCHAAGWEIQHYAPPPEKFRDFSLIRVTFPAPDAPNRCRARATASAELPTIGLGFCVDGEGYVNNVRVRMGDCFAVPYGVVTFGVPRASTGRCEIFVASTNTLTGVAPRTCKM